jgi:hypothetical protein
MEPDRWVRDPEPAEEWAVEQEVVEVQDRVAAGEGWTATAREQDLRVTACVLHAALKSHIRQEHPATRSTVLNVEPR